MAIGVKVHGKKPQITIAQWEWTSELSRPIQTSCLTITKSDGKIRFNPIQPTPQLVTPFHLLFRRPAENNGERDISACHTRTRRVRYSGVGFSIRQSTRMNGLFICYTPGVLGRVALLAWRSHVTIMNLKPLTRIASSKLGYSNNLTRLWICTCSHHRGLEVFGSAILV